VLSVFGFSLLSGGIARAATCGCGFIGKDLAELFAKTSSVCLLHQLPNAYACIKPHQKIIVGTDLTSDSTTFNASIKRESSPPEAILANCANVSRQVRTDKEYYLSIPFADHESSGNPSIETCSFVFSILSGASSLTGQFQVFLLLLTEADSLLLWLYRLALPLQLLWKAQQGVHLY